MQFIMELNFIQFTINFNLVINYLKNSFEVNHFKF